MIEQLVWVGLGLFAAGAYLFMFRQDMERVIGVLLQFAAISLLYLVFRYGFSVGSGEELVLGIAAGQLLIFLGVLFGVEWLWWIWQNIKQV